MKYQVSQQELDTFIGQLHQEDGIKSLSEYLAKQGYPNETGFIKGAMRLIGWDAYKPFVFRLSAQGKDLSGADLSNISFIETDFSYSNLCDTNLSNTNLASTNFSYTNLTNINLCNAFLFQTDFTDSIIIGANLTPRPESYFTSGPAHTPPHPMLNSVIKDTVLIGNIGFPCFQESDLSSRYKSRLNTSINTPEKLLLAVQEGRLTAEFGYIAAKELLWLSKITTNPDIKRSYATTAKECLTIIRNLPFDQQPVSLQNELVQQYTRTMHGVWHKWSPTGTNLPLELSEMIASYTAIEDLPSTSCVSKPPENAEIQTSFATLIRARQAQVKTASPSK